MKTSILKRAWAKAKEQSEDHQERLLKDAIFLTSINPVYVFPMSIAIVFGGIYASIVGWPVVGIVYYLLGLLLLGGTTVHYLVKKNQFEKKYLGGK